METNQFKDNVTTASLYLERAGINVPHTQLLEAISKAFGERNWSTLRARLETTPATPSKESLSRQLETWDFTKGPLPENLFVHGAGNYCPCCGGRDVESEAVQADGPMTWDESRCEGCGSTWSVAYGISGYFRLNKAAPT